MLDRLDVALRRYEQTRHKPDEPISSRKSQELLLWLEDDVCAIAEDLIDRPDFQAEARWPIDHLAAQAATDERGMVRTIDAELVEFALRLATFARLPAVRTSLIRVGRHNELLPEADPKGSDIGSTSAKGPSTPLGLPTIDYIARRPWRDLVTVQDYFYPASDLNLSDREAFLGPTSGHVQVVQFLPFFNPRLQSLGDFVARTLLIRIKYWQGVLQRFLVRCQIALQHAAQDGGSEWEKILEVRRQLHEHAEKLQQLCLGGRQAEVRKSCMALLQVYAEYRPHVNLHWLGLPNWARTGSWIRHRVEHEKDLGIGEQLAAALLNVAGMFRKNVDPDALVEAKCQSCPLVVVTGQGRRDVYWKGQCLGVDWLTHNAAWDLFVAMVERVKSAQGADVIDLKKAIFGPLKDRRYRLKQVLPSDLNDKIEPAGRGTYLLALRPEEVCLLRFEDNEELIEIDGAGGMLQLG